MSVLRNSAILLLLAAGCAFAGFDSRVGAPQPGGPTFLPPGVVPRDLEGVGIDEHLGLPADLSLMFIAENGNPVALQDYFHKGRPVILNLVYYTCPNLCDLILNGQVAAMREIPWTPGKEYEIVTISIDPQESFDIASKKKATYLGSYDRPGRGIEDGWHFLTDHEGNAKKLAEQVGYHYRYDRRQQQFAHPAAIIILTPEGKIARYLYGARFRSRDMRFALAEASEGRMTLTVDKILLWCYHYDPQANTYVLFAANVMRIGGALTVFVMAFFIWRLFRNERVARVGRHSRKDCVASIRMHKGMN